MRLPRHPRGCMAAVSCPFLFSFGFVARGWTAFQTIYRLFKLWSKLSVCFWVWLRGKYKCCPDSTLPRCHSPSYSSRHQFSHALYTTVCQKTPQIRNHPPALCRTAQKVQFCLFLGWIDLLRKGISLEAKGTLTDGYARRESDFKQI